MTRWINTLPLAFAAAVPAAWAQQGPDNLNPQQAFGRQVLAQSCGVCHLQPSRGSVTFGPPLNRASTAGNDEVMRTLIVSGTDRMPGFGYYLKPAEIDAIIAYVRTVPAPVTSASNDTKK